MCYELSDKKMKRFKLFIEKVLKIIFEYFKNNLKCL